MTFRIGQKVVCVEPGRTPAELWAGKHDCVVGDIYTVRAIHRYHDGEKEVGLLVEEIFNPSFEDGEECGFYIGRFRPVVSRKTSIEIFTAMLTPTGVDA